MRGNGCAARGNFQQSTSRIGADSELSLGAEVLMCLLHLVVQRDTGWASNQMARRNEMLDKLPPEFRRLFEGLVRAKLNDIQ